MRIPRTLIVAYVVFTLALPTISSAQTNPCPNGEVLITDQDRARARAAGIPDSSRCWNPASNAAGADVGEAKQYLESLWCGGRPAQCNKNGTNNVSTISDLNPQFATCAAKFLKAVKQQDPSICITSAYRTSSHQQCICGGGSVGCAAPGRSNHQQGLALDLRAKNYTWLHQQIDRFPGLRYLTIANDPYHMEAVKGGPCHAPGHTPSDFTANPNNQPTPTGGLANQFRQALGMPQQPTAPMTSSGQVAPTLPLPTQLQFCMPEYSCSGNNLIFKNSNCATQIQQTCPLGCSNGACITSSTSTNTGVGDGIDASSSTPIDILDYLSGATATSTDVATATPLQLIASLGQQQSLSSTQQPQPRPVVQVQSISNLQPGSQQTFTSSDLGAGMDDYSYQSYGGVFTILESMKNALLKALEYLRPFSITQHRAGAYDVQLTE